TYVINRGDFTVGSKARVLCDCPNPEDSVTIVLTSTGSANQIGHVNINAQADVVLRAPSGAGDPYRGILMYQDRRAPVMASNANMLNGGSSMNLHGGIYFPKQGLQISGNN